MLFSIFSAIPSAGATSTTPVKLIYATPNGVDGIGASGYIEVENIAYERMLLFITHITVLTGMTVQHSTTSLLTVTMRLGHLQHRVFQDRVVTYL